MFRPSLSAALLLGTSLALAAEADPFQNHFEVAASDWSNNGRGAYFLLIPGTALTLEGQEEGVAQKLVITVLEETKKVDGVETRVVEEREWHGEELVEVSRNYFALSTKDGSVYYFGEAVDNYKGGKVSNHGGSWQSGEKGAKFGLWLPGSPKVGQKFYEEMAPGQALDRAEVKSVTLSYETPAGTFKNCVELEETSGLEKGEKEKKVFAPGVGPLMDDVMKLTALKPAPQARNQEGK